MDNKSAEYCILWGDLFGVKCDGGIACSSRWLHQQQQAAEAAVCEQAQLDEEINKNSNNKKNKNYFYKSIASKKVNSFNVGALLSII